MSTEVTPDLMRTVAAAWEGGTASDDYARHELRARADHMEHLQRPLPTVPGWYPGIVVERGGESCTGALLADDDGWRTEREVGGFYGHWIEGTPSFTIRWADQDGKTPGQTLWEAEPNRGVAWSSVGQTVKALYERIANAVLAAHGTPTLTPVGEHPEPGTHGLLPVTFNERDGNWHFNRTYICRSLSPMADVILADPRPDGGVL